MENKPIEHTEEDPFARPPNQNKKHVFYFVLVLLVELGIYFIMRTNWLIIESILKTRQYATILFYVLIAQVIMLFLVLDIPGENNVRNLLKAMIFISIMFIVVFLFGADLRKFFDSL